MKFRLRVGEKMPFCRVYREYFIPGLEIATFSTEDELLERIQYFLSHDREREALKNAGYKRALNDHTFQKRFEDIFQIIFQQKIAKL